MIEVTMSMTEDLIPEPIVKTEKVMKEEKINMMSLNTTDLITREEETSGQAMIKIKEIKTKTGNCSLLFLMGCISQTITISLIFIIIWAIFIYSFTTKTLLKV